MCDERAVGIEAGMPAFGRPVQMTGAQMDLHSWGDNVSAGNGYSIHLEIVVCRAVHTSPHLRYPTLILSAHI